MSTAEEQGLTWDNCFDGLDLHGAVIFIGYQWSGSPPVRSHAMSYRIRTADGWYGNSVPATSDVTPEAAREIWAKVLGHDAAVARKRLGAAP